MPTTVATSIPAKVTRPMAWRLSQPAPEENTSGSTPTRKLHAVIMKLEATDEESKIGYHPIER